MKESRHKEYLLHDSIYIKVSKMESRLVVALGQGKRAGGRDDRRA